MKLSWFCLLVFVTFFVFHTTSATLGVDMSLQQCQSASSANWNCLRNKGYSFAIVEAWNGGFQYNSKIKQCTEDAWNSGMAHVDVYAFMCPNCRGNTPAKDAVTRMIQNLKNDGVRFGMLWFDVEQCDGCWNSFGANIQFLQEAVNTAKSILGADKVGVYSSVYEWQKTVGSSCKNFADLPLWYAHYDSNPSFSDSWAYQFGGWNKPAIKQYYDHGPSDCGVDVDVNFY